MAANGVKIRGIFTGKEYPVAIEDKRGAELPTFLPTVTHLSICLSLTVIPQDAFDQHPNIVAVDCHSGVKLIKEYGFCACPSLQRLILLGVEEIEMEAFCDCKNIQYIECDNLEIIRCSAFSGCVSLNYIDLPSARIIEFGAFSNCKVLRYVKFGKCLDRLGAAVFAHCPSLERITIPLKNGLIEHDDVFTECDNLKHVDFVEAAILQETMATLLMEEWTQDMRNVIGSINQILPNTPAGTTVHDGGKARAIREWIVLVLRKIKDYKAQHHLLLNEAATILQLNLPNDIVHKNVLAFYELPLHEFDGEDDAAIEASTQRHTSPPTKRLKTRQREYRSSQQTN